MAKEYRSQKNRESFEQMVPEAVMAGNIPPQAVELEEAVLGALMLEADAVTTVQEYLVEDAFYTAEHRLIYRAIEELSLEQKPIDLYTVTNRLESKNELTSVGGATYLAQLTQRVGSAANVEFHARIIAQKYVQRELISTSVEIQKRSYDSASDVNDLIAYAEGAILKVTEGHIKRSVQSAGDILQKTIKQIEKASQNSSKYSGVCSGFKAIDDITLGWQPSDLIILAARPSMGKTAFVLTMARNMAVEYDCPVAFFSLEMSSTQLMTRLIVAETGLTGTLIRSGKLSPEQWKQLEISVKPLGTAPLYIDDTPALSIFEFRSKARRLQQSKGIKIIIIDYLQLMTGGDKQSGKGSNREQEVAFISRTLKAIAKELDVPVIALSQLSRQTELRGGSRKPQLSDLRESGAIEQDADIVAFIHRPEYYGLDTTEDGRPTAGLAEIIIAKHRNGEVTDVPLRFIKEQARFTDMDIMNHVPGTSYTEQYDEMESSSFSHGDNPLSSMTGAEEFSQPSSAKQDLEPF